jgi:hypothetical protein
VAKKKKTTAKQEKAKKLWSSYLKGHIVGFITPRTGQSNESPGRIGKAVRKGDLGAVKKELKRLEKDKEGFVYPIFVEKEINVEKADKLSKQTRAGNKVYKVPETKMRKRLQKAWEGLSKLAKSYQPPASKTPKTKGERN